MASRFPRSWLFALGVTFTIMAIGGSASAQRARVPNMQGPGPTNATGGSLRNTPGSEAADQPATDDAEGNVLTSLVLGQPLPGELTTSDGKLSDDSYFDCYTLQTSQGERYRVLMRSSNFDAYLSVGSGQCSGNVVQSDDDGGGGTDAAVAFTGDGQTWFVRANSLYPETTGLYEVELIEGTQATLDHAKARQRPRQR